MLAESILAGDKPRAKKGGAPKKGSSPMRIALKEAWNASKADNFDEFAEAFEAALTIKASEE